MTPISSAAFSFFRPLKVATIAAASNRYRYQRSLRYARARAHQQCRTGSVFLEQHLWKRRPPMLQRVEGDDANRVIELPGHKIVDDGFEVGALDLGFAVNGAIL